LAERHLHVSSAQARAALHGGLHGRLLEVHRGARDGASPEEHARDRGPQPCHRGVRVPEGDPDGPGAAVHGVARGDGLRAGARQARHPPRQEPASAPGDRGQARAVVEDAVGGIPVAHGLRRLRRLPAQGEALRRLLQFQAAAPVARGDDAVGPVLRGRATASRDDREGRGGERPGPGHAAARAQALLPRGTARRPGPDDRGCRRGAARADGERATDEDPDRKGARRWRRDLEP